MSADVLQDAKAAHQAGNLTEAARLYKEMLRQDPKHFYVRYLLGCVFSQVGQFGEAERLMGQAIQLNPHWPEALYNRGCMLQRLGRHEDAIACFEETAAQQPDMLDAVSNRGFSLMSLGRNEEALTFFEQALRAKTADANLWNCHANALGALGRHEEALKSLELALRLDPNFVGAWSNLGVILHRMGRHDDAVASLNRALQLKPDVAAALNNRGNALVSLRRYELALADFDRAAALYEQAGDQIRIQGLAEVSINRGTTLLALGQNAEAIACYDRALALRPDQAQALKYRANALVIEKRFDEAARDLEALLALEPGHAFIPGILAHCRLQSCDWRTLDRDRETIANGLAAGTRVTPPFEYTAIARSAEEQLAAARIYAADKATEAQLWRGEKYSHRRIRLAYLFAGFQNHAVASATSRVIAHHAKDRFETFGFSFARNKTGAGRSRISGAFERFFDIERKGDAEAAQLLRQMEIDIAVDLMGYTGECRPEILAYRPAPIQVSFLGYPGTMGASHIDYIVADRAVIPEEAERFYIENVARLPHSYMPQDNTRRIAEATPTREDAGLPESGFVFCSFNTAYTYSPEIFDVWMRLLKEVPGSLLWVPGANAAAARNLAQEAEHRGIGPGRLRFARFIESAEEHLARLRLADLFLDTLPFNAHATAVDALWTGLPVLTCAGGTFAGRVAASLLAAVGLPELVTQSLAEYEALALRLARDGAMLAATKAKLARNLTTAPLFDTARFTRHLESAFETMHQRHLRGEKPAAFAVCAEPAAA